VEGFVNKGKFACVKSLNSVLVLNRSNDFEEMM